MQKNNQKSGGFTLIEVLVVVLIIGILTSVALPQYQKAVEKARVAEALQALAQLRDAQLVFYDTYGRWATKSEIDALDITIPSAGIDHHNRSKLNKYFSFTPQGDDPENIALLERIGGEEYLYYLGVKTYQTDKIVCGTYSNTPTYMKKICEHIDETGSL